jgi:hypothetical protein
VGRILRSILAEVLLYIGGAMRLTASCQSWDTYCRCCFVLASEMCFAEGVVVAGAAVVEDHVPVDEDVLLCVAVLSELLFPIRFVAA